MIRSTNLCLNTPAIDLTKLNADYQLVKYEFPAYSFRSKTDKNFYTRLLLAYKKVIDYPFYFFSRNRPAAAFYVLYPRTITPETLTFDDLNESAQPEPVVFADLLQFNPESGKNDKLHILLKVLLANYFWNESERQRRICQSDFYVLGRPDPKKDYKVTGVKLALNHYETLTNFQDEFCLAVKAENIVKYQPSNKLHNNFQPYYEELIKGGTTYYRQLNPLRIREATNQVWHLERKSNKNRASLEWHLPGDDRKNTRGYIAHRFLQKFVAYLNNMIGGGTNLATAKVYSGQKFDPKYKGYAYAGSSTGLPLKTIETIYVFDNRLRSLEGEDTPINAVPFQNYVDLLNNTFSKDLLITFKAISREALFANDFCSPVLILQDADKRLFGRNEQDEEEVDDDSTQEIPVIPQFNPLADEGFDDPKAELYARLKHVPKQTLTVNPNKAFNNRGEFIYQNDYRQYFDYPIFSVDAFKHRLRVSLNELYLKYLIIRKLSVTDSETRHYFPGFTERPTLKQYTFLHKNYFLFLDSEKRLQFTDIRQPAGRKTMIETLEKMSIDFSSISTRFDEKYYLLDGDDENQQQRRSTKWKKARFIFAPGVCVEIEEPDERVLFPYSANDNNGHVRTGKRNTEQTDLGIIGIHYIPEGTRYIVGRTDQPKYSRLDKATRVRRFDVYTGADKFDPDIILETMAVQFVRNEQYTVYPFFFDLINLHLENIGE